MTPEGLGAGRLLTSFDSQSAGPGCNVELPFVAPRQAVRCRGTVSPFRHDSAGVKRVKATQFAEHGGSPKTLMISCPETSQGWMYVKEH